MAIKKFGGVSGRKEQTAAKKYSHLETTVGQKTKEQAKSMVTDRTLVSGSIVYNLTASGSAVTPTGDSEGNNWISFPFANPTTAYEGNGEEADPKCGYWTPTQLDREFDYKIIAIFGEMLQGTTKTVPSGSTGVDGASNTGSWEGSLEKIWPWQAYWVKVTGSANVQKTITKQLIPPDVKTYIHQGWNSRAWPFSEFTRVSASGMVPDGNDYNIIDGWISEGSLIQRCKDFEGYSFYQGYQPGGGPNLGAWEEQTEFGTGTSFTFKTGSGASLYYDGHQGTRFGNLFRQYASSGSDSGEGNDDSGSGNYYTGSADACIGSSSTYVGAPISNGWFVPGQGQGTFQVSPSSEYYIVRINTGITGSNGVLSCSIFNHDYTQIVTPSEWGTSTGSIAVGLYNLSGTAGPNAMQSGSTDSTLVHANNYRCFGSAPFPSHPQFNSPNETASLSNTPWFWMYPQLNDQAPSPPFDVVRWYPTGSNQTSSIHVYHPHCDRVYMARLYEFSNSQPSYSYADMLTATDVTEEITGSKYSWHTFNNHFIRLRNDVI